MLPCGKDNKTEGAIGFIICHLDASAEDGEIQYTVDCGGEIAGYIKG